MITLMSLVNLASGQKNTHKQQIILEERRVHGLAKAIEHLT